MKLVCRLLFIFTLLINFNAFAQNRYSVSGIVTDESGAIQKGATVFISGSKKITSTDDNGRFEFTEFDAGTYQLSVKLLGFYPYTENIQVHNKPVKLNVELKVKTTILNEVVIGKGNNWEANYAIFKEQFLGTSANAKQCVITNPKILHFGSTSKNRLTAEADEFLVIENNQLGYRIRYLLKSFEFIKNLLRTKYDGDTNFEEMDGTPEMKVQWAKNRATAYNGSLMHYLRSVYNNTALKEGFITHQLKLEPKGISKILVADPRLLETQTFVTPIDTSFISLKFKSILIDYAPEEATDMRSKGIDTSSIRAAVLGRTMGSVLNLFLDYAVVDRKGSYTDYRTFLVQGYWGRRRIGDQLPFEYKPPVVTQ
jgi:hypothetical protein